MGKRERKRKRQFAARVRPSFHVLIASTATLGEIDLSHETEMIKAALLYADRVTLASPKALLLFGFAAVFSADRTTRLRAIRDMVSVTPEGARAFQQLEDATRTSRGARRHAIREELESQLLRAGEEMALAHEETLAQAGAQELVPAIQAGLLEIHPLGSDEITDENYWDRLLEELVAVMTESVRPTATTYPLFENSAGGLLRSIIAEAETGSNVFDRANQVGVARNLIGGLDAFPNASMDVVLDVRERIKDSLVRFRSAVAEAAAVDPGFDRAVEDIRLRVVAPALLELEEDLRSLDARTTLLRGWAAGGSGAVLAFIAAAAAGASDYAQLGAAGIAASVPVVNELLRRHDAEQALRRNGFFFLYEADRELARRVAPNR
jgi:hypothetical protein